MIDGFMDIVVARYNYWMVIVLMMIGFYVMISRGHLVKKIIGLNVFQTSAFMLYISIGKIRGGEPPILSGAGHGEAQVQDAAQTLYSNPLPHVLILTAIVVGIATTSLGLALAVRIKEAYGTLEEDEIEAIDRSGETA